MAGTSTGIESGSSSGASATIGMTILVIGSAAGLYSSFCPSWFTVSSDFFNTKGRTGNERRIRQGEAAATALSLLEGAGSALIVRNALPFIGAVIISAVMVAGYEWAMAHPSSDEDLSGDLLGVSLYPWRSQVSTMPVLPRRR
jgi:hypothetical protein